MKKQQRNEKCLCGSTLKYKNCCGKPESVLNQAELSRISRTLTTLDRISQIKALKGSSQHPILQNHTSGMPYEFDISDQRVSVIQEIAKHIRGNVQNVNAGGCGLFALLLQGFVGGDIYHLCLSVELSPNEYVFHFGHEFLMIDGYCYDADGVCRESTLLKEKQPLRRANSLQELKGTKREELYCLYKITPKEIHRKYENGEYMSILFHEEDFLELMQNAENLKDLLAA